MRRTVFFGDAGKHELERHQNSKFWQVCNLSGSALAVWQLFFAGCFGGWREERTAKLVKCSVASCKLARTKGGWDRLETTGVNALSHFGYSYLKVIETSY